MEKCFTKSWHPCSQGRRFLTVLFTFLLLAFVCARLYSKPNLCALLCPSCRGHDRNIPPSHEGCPFLVNVYFLEQNRPKPADLGEAREAQEPPPGLLPALAGFAEPKVVHQHPRAPGTPRTAPQCPLCAASAPEGHAHRGEGDICSPEGHAHREEGEAKGGGGT